MSPPFEGGPVRLDIPPPPTARAALPESFGQRFLVFIDTEEEFDWFAPFRRDATATDTVRALPEAQRRLRGFGIVPTYLVDYPVAADPRSADALGAAFASGEATLGSSSNGGLTHGWSCAPSAANSFVGNLPEASEGAKLRCLLERVEQAFGRAPLAYRAGRYGLGPHSAALLEAAGLRLDVSVRALFDYRYGGGPDFARHPLWPYWAGPRASLLELPLGASWTGRLRGFGGPLYRTAGAVPFLRGALDRLGLLSRIALTPEEMPVGQVLDAIRHLLAEGVSLISLSFHSPSLPPDDPDASPGECA